MKASSPNLTAKLLLISGTEEAIRRRTLLEIIEKATAVDDFDLETFHGDTSTPADWIASAGTAPFLSERRTAIVRNLLRYDEPVEIATAKNLPDSAALVLVADDEPGDENKQRRISTLRKNWEKAVKAAGGEVIAVESDPKQIGEQIRQESARLGKKLSSAAAETLADMTGRSLSKAIEELEKLAIFIGDEPNVRESDIRSIVVPTREWSVWKLLDAIIEDSPGEGLRQLRILVGSSTKAEEAAFSQIFPTVGKHLRLLWQARICVENNCQPGSIPQNLSHLFPPKNSIAKVAPYRQSKLMAQARRLNFDQLTASIVALRDADSRLKGLADGFSAFDTLERMVLDMAAILSPANAPVGQNSGYVHPHLSRI